MSSPTIKTHRSLETLIRLRISGKVLPVTGGSASLISLSGTPLLGVVFHVSLNWFHGYKTTMRFLDELHTTLPGDKLHSLYQNGYDTRGRKLHTVGRSWIMDVKASDHGAHTLYHHMNIGMHIKHDMVYSSTQRTQSDINATFQWPGQPSFLTN